MEMILGIIFIAIAVHLQIEVESVKKIVKNNKDNIITNSCKHNWKIIDTRNGVIEKIVLVQCVNCGKIEKHEL